MATVKLTLEVIPVYSLFGVRKAYKLPDMSYAEWLILEKGYPRYYFYMFDKIYDPYRAELDSQKSIEQFLENQFKKHQKQLEARSSVKGFYNWDKTCLESFELEKLPPGLLL